MRAGVNCILSRKSTKDTEKSLEASRSVLWCHVAGVEGIEPETVLLRGEAFLSNCTGFASADSQSSVLPVF